MYFDFLYFFFPFFFRRSRASTAEAENFENKTHSLLLPLPLLLLLLLSLLLFHLSLSLSLALSPLLSLRCGPQPNRRLLLNYGIVDESNPSDAESVTITLPNDDPLFAAKRAALQRGSSATTATFKLTAKDPLPAGLIPYLRLAFCPDEAFVAGADPLKAAAGGEASPSSSSSSSSSPSSSSSSPPPLGPEVEAAALGALMRHLRRRLSAYGTTIAEDDATVASEGAGPRQKVAARLLRIEKRILGAALQRAEEAARASGVDVGSAAAAAGGIAVRLS